MQRSSSTFTTLVRAVFPRSLRNTIRKPGTSIDRLIAKWKNFRGEVAEVLVQSDWIVRCHPLCVGEFAVFQSDPEQKLELQCFASFASPGMRFLDVGTHWGLFTLAALRFGGSDARVIGIEASNAAAKVYIANLAINDAAENVTVITAACGDKVGELKMLSTGAGGADYFVVPSDNRSDTTIVPQVSIDHVVDSHDFSPTHIKIDVEGFEEEVLVGARKTLLEHRPIIFLELHGDLIHQRRLEPQTVLDELRTLGYSTWKNLDGSNLDEATVASNGFKIRFVAMPD